VKFVWPDPTGVAIRLSYAALRAGKAVSVKLYDQTGRPAAWGYTATTQGKFVTTVLADRVGMAAFAIPVLDALAVTAVVGGTYAAPSGDEVSFQLEHTPGKLSGPDLSVTGPLTMVRPQSVGKADLGTYVAPLSTEVTNAPAPNPRIPPYTFPPAVGNQVTLPPDGFIRGHGEPVVLLSASGYAKQGVSGAGAATVGFLVDGYGEVSGTATATGAVPIVIEAQGFGKHGVRGSGTASVTLTATAAGAGIHAIGAKGSISLALTCSGAGKHGYGGSGQVAVQLSAVAVGEHTRYEVRGEVRLSQGGVLLSRSVRVCDRDTGALVAIGDSLGGTFHLHCGLAPAEYTVMVVDTSPEATDYSVPVTNRVVSVLARDAA
jgi:hypothetical protein